MSEHSPTDPGADLSVVFAALANPDRLAILDAMRERSATSPGQAMTVTEVAAAVELSRFSASRHLRILCAAGLVDVTRRGQALLHHIEPAGFEFIEDWLYPLADTAARSVAHRPLVDVA